MRISRQKSRFRTAELALKRRDQRPFSTRRFKHLQRAMQLHQLAERAFNPDGHVDIQLPCGGWARVSPDIAPETLAALDQMMRLAAEQYGFALPNPAPDPFASAFEEPLPQADNTQVCDQPGCANVGNACFLPDSEEPFCYYCFTHAHPNGFCGGCGLFWAGNESFDFGGGLCDNCRSSL